MLHGFIQRLRGAHDDERGFTLIELLVVILIIGILAAIALPTFLGQKDKGKDASAKSNVRNAVTQMSSCLTDGTPTTCATDAATLQALGTGGKIISVGGQDSYELQAVSDSKNTFNIKDDAGTFTRTCQDNDSGKGSCSNSTW